MTDKLTLDEMIKLGEISSGWEKTHETRSLSNIESYIGMFKELLLIISLDYDHDMESTPKYSITVKSGTIYLGTYDTYDKKKKEYGQLSELYQQIKKKYDKENDEYLIVHDRMTILDDDSSAFAEKKKKLQEQMAIKTNERLDYAKSLLNDSKKK